MAVISENIITGKVFNIQHFSIHDGPGIRTTVFMKGCPLSCVWCHNPESIKKHTELSYNSEKCSGCGACLKICENKGHVFNTDENGDLLSHALNRENCMICGKCAGVCYYNSLELIGKDYTADEVIKDVMRDGVFYETSGGGITLSGGEPMYQFDFTLELLKKSKINGLHTCIETSGFASPEQFERIIPYIDLFLYDYKYDYRLPEKHKEYCGVSNEVIMKNLKLLNDSKSKIILRCPIIPGINDNSEHFKSIAETAEKYDGITEVDLEPYHPLGISKNMNIGKGSSFAHEKFLDKAVIKEYEETIQNLTSKKVEVL